MAETIIKIDLNESPYDNENIHNPLASRYPHGGHSETRAMISSLSVMTGRVVKSRTMIPQKMCGMLIWVRFTFSQAQSR
jgi:hypothetical protein